MSTDTPQQKTRRTAGKPIPLGAYGNVTIESISKFSLQ